MSKRFAWLCCAVLLAPAAVRAQDEVPDRTVRILRTTNKAQTNAYVVKAYELRNVNPFAVLRFIRRPVQAEEGAVFTFAAPDMASGIAVVAVPEWMIPSMDDLMQEIDRPGLTSTSGTSRAYVQLRHRRANVSSDPVLDDSAFVAQLAVYLTGNESRAITDPEQNAVFIEDAPSGIEALSIALAADLDVPTPQVIFNIRLYEISVENNTRLGLDYVDWKNGPGAPLFALGGFLEGGQTELRNGAPGFLNGINGGNAFPPDGSLPRRLLRSDFKASGTNFAYNYELHSGFFDYLTTRGKARVINSARIAVLDGRSATITAGDQILYYSVSSTDPSDIRGQDGEFGDIFAANIGRTVTPQLTSIETGLQISLTPIIHENGLDVSIDTRIETYNGFDDTGLPRIGSRESSDAVRMGEGQELVLGGLMREEKVDSGQKAPWLGKIPVLGWIFGQENNRRRHSEIFLVLEAEQIVRFDGDTRTRAEDQSVMDQATGAIPIETPPTRIGFDQWRLDPEKGADPPNLR